MMLSTAAFVAICAGADDTVTSIVPISNSAGHVACPAFEGLVGVGGERCSPYVRGMRRARSTMRSEYSMGMRSASSTGMSSYAQLGRFVRSRSWRVRRMGSGRFAWWQPRNGSATNLDFGCAPSRSKNDSTPRSLLPARPSLLSTTRSGRRARLSRSQEACAYALRMRGERKRPSHGWSSLTPTEVEVVDLVAAGLTNPQIAERLLVETSTVKTHLHHIFTKLGITTRAQLAAEAVRRS